MTERERLIELLNRVGGKVLYIPTDKFIENLADYLLENGAILPPCKIGDNVYSIFQGRILREVVHSFKIYPNEFYIYTIINNWHLDDVGKTVFLTKEEAEKALSQQ